MTVGRFAPTPSGFLHPGNLACALLAWLSARAQGGRFLLRIEDLDRARSPKALADAAIEALQYLGLTWDETPVWQSQRTQAYAQAFSVLQAKGLVYPCFCTRAELHAAQAPNQGDAAPIYDRRCKHLSASEIEARARLRTPAMRLRVPDEIIRFEDGLQGVCEQDLARACGDFILRRSDGIYAYQLAVVLDDAASGVTEVVRGRDILESTPRQILLQRLLGLPTPHYVHIPLVTDSQGRRLSKREGDIALPELARRYKREEILGMLGAACGLLDEPRPATLPDLLSAFDWQKVPREAAALPPSFTR